MHHPGMTCRGNAESHPPLSCPGLTGASSTPRLLGSITAVSGILDRPVKAGDDSEGCGAERTTTPIVLQMGDADEEVNPEFCAHVARRSLAAGTPIEATFYPGATHDFDDPGEKHQDNPDNAAAKAAAMAKAAQVIDGYAKQP